MYNAGCERIVQNDKFVVVIFTFRNFLMYFHCFKLKKKKDETGNPSKKHEKNK